MKSKYLESDRLIYEPLSLVHLSQTYVDWMNDEKVIKYLDSGGNYTIEELELFLKEQEEKDILFWAIILKSTKKHIGNIKIDPINESENSGEYGIMMGDRNEWGKGFAKEASNRIIEYCFKEINLSAITLGVIEKNISAVELYKKMGFDYVITKYNVGEYDGVMCNSIRMIKKND